MSQHPVYGLLYIVLLPVAFLLGLSTITSLPVALGTPLLLILISVMACYVIYTIATLIFYLKAVQQQKTCKPSLRDLIRVNAFVIIVPTTLIIINCTFVTLQPSLLQEAVNQFKEVQQQSFPFSLKIMWAIIYIMLVYMIVVLIHIIYTFRLLRNYKSAFDYKDISNG